MSDGLKMKYFVLNPGKQDAYGEASRAAMREYARCIEKENKTLAWELESWVYEAGGIGFSDEERAAADVFRAKRAAKEGTRQQRIDKLQLEIEREEEG